MTSAESDKPKDLQRERAEARSKAEFILLKSFIIIRHSFRITYTHIIKQIKYKVKHFDTIFI